MSSLFSLIKPCNTKISLLLFVTKPFKEVIEVECPCVSVSNCNTSLLIVNISCVF